MTPKFDALTVEVEHVAERAGVDELLQRLHARVVEEQVARHEHEVALLGERDELVHLGAAHRRWLLDEHVLARLERALGEGVVLRHVGRDRDRVEALVLQQVVERLRPARVRMLRGGVLAVLGLRVAEPGELGELAEVPGDVPSPRPEAHLAELHKLPDLVGAPALLAGCVPEVDDELRARRRGRRSRSPSGP